MMSNINDLARVGIGLYLVVASLPFPFLGRARLQGTRIVRPVAMLVALVDMAQSQVLAVGLKQVELGCCEAAGRARQLSLHTLV